jgi:hypothetical protein
MRSLGVAAGLSRVRAEGKRPRTRQRRGLRFGVKEMVRRSPPSWVRCARWREP